MKYLKHLEKVDILSPTPQLRINSKLRFQSIFGGIMTLLSVTACMVLVIYFMVITFSRDKIMIMKNEEIFFSPSVNLLQQPHAFFLTDKSGVQIKSAEKDRYYNFKTYYTYFNRKTSTLGSSEVPIDAECSKSFKKYWDPEGEYKEAIDTYGKVIKSYNLSCIDQTYFELKDKEIYNVFADTCSSYGFLSLYLNRCVNTTESSNCHSNEEIDRYLGDARLHLGINNNVIDSNRKGDALTHELKKYALAVTTSIHKRIQIFLKKLVYTTDVGWVFEEFIVENGHQALKPYETYTLMSAVESLNSLVPVPGNFAEVMIANNGDKDMYNRSYFKLQELLANIGGVVKGVLIAALVIENYFAKTMNSLYFLQEFLHVDEEMLSQSSKRNPKYTMMDPSISEMKPTTKVMMSDNNINIGKNVNSNNIDSINIQKTPSKEISDNMMSSSERRLDRNNTVLNMKPTSKKIFLKLGISDYLCKQCRSNSRISMILKAEGYVKKKTSIDFIVKKLLEFDKMKFVMLEDYQIKAMNLIKSPNLNLVIDAKKGDNLQSMWWENEFGDTKNYDLKDIEGSLQMNRNPEVDRKIIKFLSGAKSVELPMRNTYLKEGQ